MSIALGEPLPDLEIAATGDKTLSLADLRDRIVVIYFYPKDNTPGCTTEGQDFTRLHEEFSAAGATILGVSRDSVRVHENFRAKHGFPFDLLSDPDETLCKAFDVIRLKKLYGREYMGVDRSTFVFDANSGLAREWRKVKVKGHADEVLATVKELADKA